MRPEVPRDSRDNFQGREQALMNPAAIRALGTSHRATFASSGPSKDITLNLGLVTRSDSYTITEDRSEEAPSTALTTGCWGQSATPSPLCGPRAVPSLPCSYRSTAVAVSVLCCDLHSPVELEGPSLHLFGSPEPPA